MNSTLVPQAEKTTRSSERRSNTLFWIKIARPGLWITTAWFYMLPLGRRPVFHTGSFWLGLFYVMVPLGFLVYGWNDLADRESDRLNPRKDSFLFGARGTQAQLRALPFAMLLIQAPFLLIFTINQGYRILFWFTCIALTNAIYNWPRIGFKNRPGLDVFNQAGYVLIFTMSSWVNSVPQLPWSTYFFGALFAMHSHLFSEIMDVEPDSIAGRRTTVSVIGIKNAKLLIALLLLIEAAIVSVCLHFATFAAVLSLGAGWMILDARRIWRDQPYSLKECRAFTYCLNLAAIVSMPFVWSGGKLAGLA